MALSNRMLGQIWRSVQKSAAGNGNAELLKKKKKKKSPREARAVMPAIEGVVALNLQSPCRLSLSSVAGGPEGEKKWEEPESPRPSWASSAAFEACKHSQLRDAQGRDWRSNPRQPPPPPSLPHADAFIQAFPPSGKSLLKRKKIRKHTQPENGKQALNYVQEKPASRGRQKQQLCHGRLVFFCHVGNAVFVCWASSSQKVSGGLLCPTTLLRKDVIKQKIKTSKKKEEKKKIPVQPVAPPPQTPAKQRAPKHHNAVH